MWLSAATSAILLNRDVIAVAWAARHVGRPLRWVETRNENLMGMVHGRAQRQTIKIGGTRDGRILAYHLDIVQDCGGYSRMGPFLASLTLLMASGVYDLPGAGAQFRAVVTNTTPISAYRGAGRPDATLALELEKSARRMVPVTPAIDGDSGAMAVMPSTPVAAPAIAL